MMEQRLGVEQDDPADEFDENSVAYRNHHLQVLKAIAGCKNLKKLVVWEQLYVEEMEVLCKNLLSHLELEYQHLWKGSIAAGDKEMELLCNLLENSDIIKTLQLWREGVAVAGAASLGLMLGVNSPWRNWTCMGTLWALMELRLYLCPLTGEHGHLRINKSIKWFMVGTRTQAVAQMLLTDDCLMHFSILSDSSLQSLDVSMILESLKNEILHTLDLLGRDLVNGDDVLVKMMNLLQATFINGSLWEKKSM
ncbi:unnamed protein product [Sphagnum tenellum]